MKSSSFRASGSLRWRAAAVALLAICATATGCGRPAGQSLDAQLAELKTSQRSTAKFAGTISIDGLAPRDAIKQGLYIMLYDPANPPTSGSAPLNAIVNLQDGSFEFTTYSQGDGVPEGSYVVLFVALKHSLLGKQQGYHQPDALQNRYNDPEKNEKNPDFKIEVKQPGKTDYRFDLKLAGTEPGMPGPKSITKYN